ncbi:hypothetical protein BWP39_12670 [Paraburkholderia acidicola]|uniref:Uncharacterized protein n=1 Tax=Paraburkholderia acidicola TaxID=1912599 RepID=A0A2A4EUT3_9BURK|nr:hypothetical protein [Paraburkholderia acidicola]PCE25373.1 hypothetical protein BWP39_12670 [Paraburkholderia acidicola]
MWIVVIGLFANLLMSYAAYSDFADMAAMGLPPSITSILLYVLVFFWVLSLAGLILILTGKKKPGAIMVIVGSVIVIPVGLVAIIGARNVIKSLGNDLDARRKLAPGGDASPPSA